MLHPCSLSSASWAPSRIMPVQGVVIFILLRNFDLRLCAIARMVTKMQMLYYADGSPRRHKCHIGSLDLCISGIAVACCEPYLTCSTA